MQLIIIISNDVILYTVGLNKLKHKLDSRLKAKDLRSGQFKSMEYIESATSLLPPPKLPVKWAVSLTATSSDAVSVESSDSSEQFSLTRYIPLFNCQISVFLQFIFTPEFLVLNRNFKLYSGTYVYLCCSRAQTNSGF